MIDLDNIELNNAPDEGLDIIELDLESTLNDVPDGGPEYDPEQRRRCRLLVLIIAGAVMLVAAIGCFIVVPLASFSSQCPTNVTITETGVHELTVMWTGVSLAQEYTITCRNEDGGEVTFTSRGSSCRKELTGLQSQTAYTVTVTASRSFPKLQSEASEEVTAKTEIPDPGIVSGLSVSMKDTFTALVTWKAPLESLKNIDGSEAALMYIIYRSENGGDYTEVKTTTETTYTDNSLKELSRYSYKIVVKATVDGENYEARQWDSEDVFTLYKEARGVTAFAGSDSILLSWDAPVYPDSALQDGETPAVTYTVLVSDTENGTYSVLAENLTDNFYEHTGLAEGTWHYYKVLIQVTIGDQKIETTEANASAIGAQTGSSQTSEQDYIVDDAGNPETEAETETETEDPGGQEPLIDG